LVIISETLIKKDKILAMLEDYEKEKKKIKSRLQRPQQKLHSNPCIFIHLNFVDILFQKASKLFKKPYFQ